MQAAIVVDIQTIQVIIVAVIRSPQPATAEDIHFLQAPIVEHMRILQAAIVVDGQTLRHLIALFIHKMPHIHVEDGLHKQVIVVTRGPAEQRHVFFMLAEFV